MSMELFVLSDHRLSSIHQWQRSIDLIGSPVRLSTTRAFAELRGALPIQAGPIASFFECDHWDIEDIRQTYGSDVIDRRWTFALALRWGGDVNSGYAANIAAAGYAQAVSGVIFDCEEGAVISPHRAIEVANELKQSQSAIDAVVREVLQQMKDGK